MAPELDLEVMLETDPNFGSKERLVVVHSDSPLMEVWYYGMSSRCFPPLN